MIDIERCVATSLTHTAHRYLAAPGAPRRYIVLHLTARDCATRWLETDISTVRSNLRSLCCTPRPQEVEKAEIDTARLKTETVAA